MKKIQSMKLTLHNFRVRSFVLFRRWRYKFIVVLKKSMLPSVIICCIVAFVLIIFWMFCKEDTRVMWEDILSQIEHKMNLIGQIITIISLCAAAVGIIISIQKPKFKLAFITEHGYGLKEKERQFGVDGNNRIGYQSCVPSDWKMLLYNVGDKVAENVKVKIRIDYITFGNVDKNSGYMLEDFVYACGVFETLSLDLIDIIRQGESVEIPRIPFEYACVEVPNLKEKEFTHMHIRIYCNNQSPIYLKYRIRLEDYDVGEYDYHSEENEFKKKQSIKKIIHEVLDSLGEYSNGESLNIYNYTDLIDPYILKRKDIKEFELRNVYKYYSEIDDMDKMVFWGRMYYRSVGMKKCDIEAIMQTEIIRRK